MDNLIELILKEKKMKRISWNALAENLPISGEALRVSFVRKSVDKDYISEICKLLNLQQIKIDVKETSINESVFTNEMIDELFKSEYFKGRLASYIEEKEVIIYKNEVKAFLNEIKKEKKV